MDLEVPVLSEVQPIETFSVASFSSEPTLTLQEEPGLAVLAD